MAAECTKRTGKSKVDEILCCLESIIQAEIQLLLGKNIVRGMMLPIPPFYKSFAQVFLHGLPDDDLDIFETMKLLDISYDEYDPTARVAEYADPWWETGSESTHSLAEGVHQFFQQVSNNFETQVWYLNSWSRYHSNLLALRTQSKQGF